MSTTTISPSISSAVAIADEINALAAAGPVEVDGRKVWAKYDQQPATAYQNGTVGVLVAGRRKGIQGTVFVKAGQRVEVVAG